MNNLCNFIILVDYLMACEIITLYDSFETDVIIEEEKLLIEDT